MCLCIHGKQLLKVTSSVYTPLSQMYAQNTYNKILDSIYCVVGSSRVFLSLGVLSPRRAASASASLRPPWKPSVLIAASQRKEARHTNQLLFHQRVSLLDVCALHSEWIEFQQCYYCRVKESVLKISGGRKLGTKTSSSFISE